MSPKPIKPPHTFFKIILWCHFFLVASYRLGLPGHASLLARSHSLRSLGRSCISNCSFLNAENRCILSHNTFQHKYDVSITLTCWFEEVNTNDCDHPHRSTICYFSYGRRLGSEPCLYSKGSECGTRAPLFRNPKLSLGKP